MWGQGLRGGGARLQIAATGDGRGTRGVKTQVGSVRVGVEAEEAAKALCEAVGVRLQSVDDDAAVHGRPGCKQTPHGGGVSASHGYPQGRGSAGLRVGIRACPQQTVDRSPVSSLHGHHQRRAVVGVPPFKGLTSLQQALQRRHIIGRRRCMQAGVLPAASCLRRRLNEVAHGVPGPAPHLLLPLGASRVCEPLSTQLGLAPLTPLPALLEVLLRQAAGDLLSLLARQALSRGWGLCFVPLLQTLAVPEPLVEGDGVQTFHLLLLPGLGEWLGRRLRGRDQADGQTDAGDGCGEGGWAGRWDRGPPNEQLRVCEGHAQDMEHGRAHSMRPAHRGAKVVSVCSRQRHRLLWGDRPGPCQDKQETAFH
mmetsp:Transcript_77695/g.136958  ORF Transcript_77695/g.136958 Transcript_77695/m.136958 type:complete len:366 (-) Transcript_77695:263-1360(-)